MSNLEAYREIAVQCSASLALCVGVLCGFVFMSLIFWCIFRR